MLQGHAIKELHGDKGAALVLADVVDGADVGMIQCRGGLRFALKAGKRLRIAGNLFGQEFQGHESVQAGIFGLINDAHAAATELLDDAVMGDGLTNHWRILRR